MYIKDNSVINLNNHKDWDQYNGTLSVSLNPKIANVDSGLYVLLNGNNGNFCLDYSNDIFDKFLAKQRAWSSDTGYYVRISYNDKVIVSRWWDDYFEELPYRKVQENPQQFYQAIIKHYPKGNDNIISFAKEAFIRLRNCIIQTDNGRDSLRVFMYLLAALEENVETAQQVDKDKWHLDVFDPSLISSINWEWLYSAFQKGINNIPPLVKLVLRHASNRLFQEAHREATRKEFQTVLWGGADRIYDSGISDGAFYTPTSLVRTIVQESLWSLDKIKPLSERSDLRILDPACGSSEFLREVLRQLKMRDYSGSIVIEGWDISEIACEMSKFVLHYENNTEWNSSVRINISKRDSLEYNWNIEEPFDMILMNPPFQSFENLGERKSIVNEQLKGLITRQPDMSAVFWKKAAEALAELGVFGLVMPHSLIRAETYIKLRTYIKEELRIDFSLVARLGSAGLFEKAMIIPAILVGTKAPRSATHTVLWTDHQQESVFYALRELRIYRGIDIPTPIVKNNYSIYDFELLTKKNSWAVKSYPLYQLSEKLEKFTTVSKLFKVSRGADAGNNAAFVLLKNDWQLLPKREQHFFRPCIMRDSIIEGQLNDSFFMFYPYGNFKIDTESDLEKKLSSYYHKTLLKYKDKLQKRRGRNEKWWELNEHRPWQVILKPKLISAYFGKAGYFAYDQKGKYLVGQSFAWLPLKSEIDNDQYLYAYLALLHAPLIDKLLEMVCNVLEGGYYDLSKHYVDHLPIPDLTKADNSIVNALANMGQAINEGSKINYDNLNQEVANAYGINLDLIKSG